MTKQDTGSLDVPAIARCGCGSTQQTLVLGAVPQQQANGVLPIAIIVPPGWTMEAPALVMPGQPAMPTIRCPRCANKAARAANADASKPPAKVLSMDAGKERAE